MLKELLTKRSIILFLWANTHLALYVNKTSKMHLIDLFISKISQ